MPQEQRRWLTVMLKLVEMKKRFPLSEQTLREVFGEIPGGLAEVPEFP